MPSLVHLEKSDWLSGPTWRTVTASPRNLPVVFQNLNVAHQFTGYRIQYRCVDFALYQSCSNMEEESVKRQKQRLMSKFKLLTSKSADDIVKAKTVSLL